MRVAKSKAVCGKNCNCALMFPYSGGFLHLFVTTVIFCNFVLTFSMWFYTCNKMHYFLNSFLTFLICLNDVTPKCYCIPFFQKQLIRTEHKQAGALSTPMESTPDIQHSVSHLGKVTISKTSALASSQRRKGLMHLIYEEKFAEAQGRKSLPQALSAHSFLL